jgi:hypothetical protein
MAEITALRNNALPYPVYGVPWTEVFSLVDADGAPVTGATCDSEISKNGDTGADCTNEGAEIPFTTTANKGMYYLSLTGAEMTADAAAVTVASATAKTKTIVLHPKKLVSLRTGTGAGGAVGYITLDAAAGATDDLWNGCLCVAVIDGNVEARIITDYTGSNQRAAVTPSFNVAPDADDTFVIYLPDGMQMPIVNTGSIFDTVIDDTVTLTQAVKVILAVCAGISGGGLTGTVTFADQVGTTAVVTATLDASGNRTAVVLDLA